MHLLFADCKRLRNRQRLLCRKYRFTHFHHPPSWFVRINCLQTGLLRFVKSIAQNRKILNRFRYDLANWLRRNTSKASNTSTVIWKAKHLVLVGQLGSGPHIVGQLGSGVTVGATFTLLLVLLVLIVFFEVVPSVSTWPCSQELSSNYRWVCRKHATAHTGTMAINHAVYNSTTTVMTHNAVACFRVRL